MRRQTSGVITLQSQIGSVSRDGRVQLQILVQPEQQHRARYKKQKLIFFFFIFKVAIDFSLRI